MHHMFPNMAVISKPNKKHSKLSLSKKKKKRPFCWVPRWRSAHVHTTLDGFVWASAEASIVRAGGGKHFISEIRRLSEPCDSECRTCLPFTHGCRLSQSRVSGATPATLPTHKVGGRAHIKAYMWHQFSFENQSNEQGKLNLKQPWNKQAFVQNHSILCFWNLIRPVWFWRLNPSTCQEPHNIDVIYLIYRVDDNSVLKEEFWFINSWQDHTELQAVLTIFFLAKVGEPTFYRHTGLQTTLWIIDGTRFADWARRTFSAQWNLLQAVGLGCTVKNRGKRKKLQSLCFPLCLEDIFLNSTEISVRHLVRWSCRWIQFSYMAGAKHMFEECYLGWISRGISKTTKNLPPHHIFKGPKVYLCVCSSMLGKACLPPFNCPHSLSRVPLHTNIPAGSCWACWEGKHSLHAPFTIDILPFLAFLTGLDSRND